MRRFAALLLASILVGGALPAGAQERSGELRLELKLARKPAVVQPAPDPKIAEQDTEQAIAEVRARERSEGLVREMLRAPSRRPDLHYDVWSGIQARNVRDALRRR